MSSRQIKIINKKSQQLGCVQWEGGCAEGPPLRMAGFLIGGSNFIFKEATKFGPFRQIFQRSRQKN